MGLWILEPKSNEKVPGTVHIERDNEEQRRLTAHLEHGTGKHEHIVLVPQPSDSINDPLNWSPRRKLFQSFFLCTGSGLAAGTCYFLNPSHGVLAKAMSTTTTELSRTMSYLMLCMGISAILTTPLARIYSKRPVFFALNIVGIIGYGILLSHPTDIKWVYAGRALWGAGMSALEYLVSSSIGDLFFVHERGFHLSLWHFALSGGTTGGQVIASQIVAGQSYVWAIRYAVIFMAIYQVAFFFLGTETTFNRPKQLDNDVHEVLATDVDDPYNSDERSNGNEKTTRDPTATESVLVSAPERKKTFAQNLKLYNGTFSNENYLRSVIAPFATYLLPGVAWAAYTYGCSVAFASSISVSLSQVFTVPPYNFTTSQVSLTVLAPFIGDVLGNFIPGPLSDWIVTYMSKKNNGIYEPEFRNVLCIPAFITGAMGFWGFGLAIHYKIHWIGPVFFYGLTAFAGSILSLVSNTYLLDCHRKYAQDGYAAVTLIKAAMTFAIAYFINNWLTQSGPIQVYFIIGAIHSFGCLLGGILYFFGKRLRLAVSKNVFIQGLLQEFGSK